MSDVSVCCGAGMVLAPFYIPREGVMGFWSWCVVAFFVVTSIGVLVIAIGDRDE